MTANGAEGQTFSPSLADLAVPAGYPCELSVESPRTGVCRAALAANPEADAGLWIACPAVFQQGSYVPLKLSPPDGGAPFQAMCRVYSFEAFADGGALFATLPKEDAKVMGAVRRWVEVAQANLQIEAVPEEIDLSDAVEVISEGQKVAISNDVLRYRYDSLVAEGDAFEAKGDLQAAFDRIERALKIFPVHAEDLHMRLAKLAGDLGRYNIAAEHARAAQQLNPSRRDAERLLRTITTQRSTHQHIRLDEFKKAERRRDRRRTVLAIALFVCVAVPLIAYNVWLYAVPHGTPPTVVAAESLEEVFPLVSARVLDDTLYIVTDERWVALEPGEKSSALAAVASRATTLLQVGSVVVSTAEPKLLAVFRGGEAKIYR